MAPGVDDPGRPVDPVRPDDPPCTEVVAAPARVLRLSKLELQNTLDALYGRPGETDVPKDSKAFGYSTGDQQTVNPPFADGLQHTVELRGAALKLDLQTSMPAQCQASESAASTCAETFIRERGRVALRRPVTTAEQTELLAIYALGRDTVASTSVGERSRAGLDYVMRALAQSATLLYRTELGPEGGTAGATVTLTSDELASALSYTVLAAPPDAELLDVAAAGRLSDAAERRSQATRLTTAQSALYAKQLERFVTEWLLLDFDKPAWAKSATVYPTFTPAVLAALKAETSLDLASWASAPRLTTLLTQTEGHVSAQTAGLYGVASPGPVARKVAFDPNERAGIFTSAAFLGTHAHTDGSAPIFRAVAVMKGALCLPLPNPPANVTPLPAVGAVPGRTTRETVENHIAAGGAGCKGCHDSINPMGFTLEAFDGIGRFRTTENGTPVDSSGAIVGTPSTDQAIAGPTALARALAQSADVHRCYTRQTFRYALGRFETSGDRCTLGQLERDFTAAGLDTTSLLQSLVASELFATRKVQ